MNDAQRPTRKRDEPTRQQNLNMAISAMAQTLYDRMMLLVDEDDGFRDLTDEAAWCLAYAEHGDPAEVDDIEDIVGYEMRAETRALLRVSTMILAHIEEERVTSGRGIGPIEDLV